MKRDVAATIEPLRAPIGEDPYRPKWDEPWWRAVTLWELGYAEAIPSSLGISSSKFSGRRQNPCQMAAKFKQSGGARGLSGG